jgi:hypothetical protein
MRYLKIVAAVLFLIPFSAHAVVCKEVNYTYNPSSQDDNAAQISASGWARVSAFGGPVGGPTGWFRFSDGTVAYAVHNGTMASIQWNIFYDNLKEAADCDATLPAPIQADDEEDEYSEDEEEQEEQYEEQEEYEEIEYEDGDCSACEIEDWDEDSGDWEDGEWIEEE